MKNVLLVIQIASSILVVGLVLLQTRGTGFGRVWGSSAASFTRRGLEQLVFKATFVLAVIFVIVSAIQLFI